MSSLTSFIKMIYKCHLHIFLLVTVFYIILLFPPKAIPQNASNLTYTKEQPVILFEPALQTLKDKYEPDNDPNQAKCIEIQISGFKVYNQFHTFHSFSDVDWVYLYAVKDINYTFYADGNHDIQMILYYNDGAKEIWPNTHINSYVWRCTQSGYYTLRLGHGSPQITTFSYLLSIKASYASILVKAGAYGRVLNEYGYGVNDVCVTIGGETEITGSIGEIRNNEYLEESMYDGWFFFGTLLSPGNYTLKVTKKGDPDFFYVPPKEITLRSIWIERIPDIQISLPEDSNITRSDPNIIRNLEIYYTLWACGAYDRWEDSNDNDGIINLEEFLNGTDPLFYSIKSALSQGLNLFPFYLEDPYTADDFCVQYLNEWKILCGYDNPNKIWRYWDINSPHDPNFHNQSNNIREENFTLERGRGYIIYKQTSENIFQDQNLPLGDTALPAGNNICPIPRTTDGLIPFSYEFMNAQNLNFIESINLYINAKEDAREVKGVWESTYMFFRRPSGWKFPLSPKDAFIIGVRQ